MRNAIEEAEVARLCREFAEGGHFPRYLLGRTPPYATSVPGAVDGRLLGTLTVYPKGADLIDIPKQMLSYCGAYRINLHHSTERIIETDMFFVPEAR